jgi:Clostripain family
MKKWTIILQMSAENDLIYNSISAFNEIGSVGSTDQVNYIILFDGMETPRYPNAPTFPSVYKMEKGMNFETAKPFKNFGEQYDHLADTKILGEIFEYIKTTFPAENFGFIYKGHGGAEGTDIASGKFYTTKILELPKGSYEEVEKQLTALGGESLEFEGYCDHAEGGKIILAIYSNKQQGEYLTYAGLAKCLSKVFADKKPAFICLDCCWGQQIEHAYTFKDVSDYFVASVDEMPSLGLGYKELCFYLNARPNILPYELAKMLVAVYFVKNYADYDSPIEYFRQMGVSLTCVNTTQLKTHLELFNRVCERVIEKINEHHSSITASLQCCKDYTYDLARGDYAVYNLDLIWFLENIMHFNKKDSVLNKRILEFIRHHFLYYIRGYMGNNYKDSSPGELCLGGRGVSICFPRNREELETSLYFGSGKPRFVKDSRWKKLLISYYKSIPRKKVVAAKKAVAKNLTSRSVGTLEHAAPIAQSFRISSKWDNFHPAKNKVN